jgi:hypothetical protein
MFQNPVTGGDSYQGSQSSEEAKLLWVDYIARLDAMECLI